MYQKKHHQHEVCYKRVPAETHREPLDDREHMGVSPHMPRAYPYRIRYQVAGTAGLGTLYHTNHFQGS